MANKSAYNLNVMGNRIKAQRKACKLTQEKLADKIGVVRQTLASWESGEVYPELPLLVKMCDIFGCDTGYLLGKIDCETQELTDICSATGLDEEAVKTLKTYSENLKSEIPLKNADGLLSLIIRNQYFGRMIYDFGEIIRKRCGDEERLPAILDKDEGEIDELLRGMTVVLQSGLEVAPSFMNDSEQIISAKQAGMNMVDEIVEQIQEHIIVPAYPNSKVKKSLECLIMAMHNMNTETQEQEEPNG